MRLVFGTEGEELPPLEAQTQSEEVPADGETTPPLLPGSCISDTPWGRQARGWGVGGGRPPHAATVQV